MLVPKNNTGKRKEPPNAPTIPKSKVPKVLENSMKKTLAIGSSTSSSNEIERGNDKNNESLEAGEIRQFTIRNTVNTFFPLSNYTVQPFPFLLNVLFTSTLNVLPFLDPHIHRLYYRLYLLLSIVIKS